MAIETRAYDLVVIGGGPAGIVAAAIGTGAGHKVALVDNHHQLGGAGINTGTVPSKTLRETALALSGLKARRLIGVDHSLKEEATVADFLRHEQHVRAGFNTMIAQQLRGDKADVYFGTGLFVDPHTVQVKVSRLRPRKGQPPGLNHDVLLRAERVLIATGSSPVRPAVFPFGSTGVYDSDTILHLDRLPGRLAVVGAGVIGSEYACVFAALGARVDLIDGREVLLPFLDTEVSHALTAAMQRDGVTFHWKEKVEDCRARGSAGVRLYFGSRTDLNVDAVLVAAGRQSNTPMLNLAAAGVTTNEHGIISVNEQFQTNVPHIYAAGDVIGFPALASTSMEQARRAARHALGLEARVPISRFLPNGIYTIPEASMVGETEETLKQQGVDYVVGRADYRGNPRGRIIGDLDGFLKLLFRRGDMKLLGVHVLGEQATEIVHIGMMVMIAGGTADAFIGACFNIPTLGALYKSATIDALLHASGGRASLTALAEA